MCGIAGVIGAIDASLEAAVEKMMSAESHRGPDDSGLYRSNGAAGVVLGFRRLAIMDLTSDGHQPMEDHESGNVVAFNGEIYNFAELRSDLERNGVHRSDHAETPRCCSAVTGGSGPTSCRVCAACTASRSTTLAAARC